jgi:peptidoglycan hydrolase-like protein with peptidoglycan-binding domain
MRHTLLRLGVALLVACALLPASAEARAGAGTTSSTQESRPAMPAGWSAGPVHRWTGYHREGGSRRVRELQRRLTRLGYRTGPVDGLFGPRTERATRRFQRRNGLRADAIAGPRTLRALRRQDARRREAPTSARPLIRAPQPVPERVAPRPPNAAPTPASPAPDLPVVAVLVAIALLGVASLVSSYLRTTARIQRMQRDGRPARTRGPTLHGEPGG